MSSVWFIVPGVGKKIITSKQWQFYGITAEDSIWGPENGWSVPESSFSAMQLNILDGDSGFLLGQEDGPRTYPPPPGDMLNDEVSGFAYYIATKKLLEQLGGSTWNNLDLSGNTELINGSTLSFYNTTDQVTNYERLRLFMNSSVYQLTSENGGSGTKRAIAIAGPVSTLTFGTSTATLNRSGSTTSTSTQFSSAATFTASTGQQSLWGFIPTINQSSTAGYTALLVNPTETATGSGTKLLADFQVGGSSKFKIDNTGVATVAAVGTAAGSLVSVDGTQPLTNKTLTNPLVNKILDTNGNTAMQFNASASAVNYAFFVNSPTGNSVSMRANGSDTNIPFALFSKGTGQVQLRSDTNGFILTGDSVASGVNYVGLTNAATGTGPSIAAVGTDTDVHLNLKAKGAGNIQIPTGTGAALFNTSDQTTNYERVRHYWSSNVYTISSDVGGTGTVRPIRIISGNTTFGINESTQSLVFTRTTPSTVLTLFDLTTAGTGLSGTSSSQYGMRINPTINQSSTAGYTMLLINPTESATGSGAKLLADFQVGGVSKFSVNNAGVEFHANVASAPATPTGGGVIYVEAGALKYKGSSGTVTVLGAA